MRGEIKIRQRQGESRPQIIDPRPPYEPWARHGLIAAEKIFAELTPELAFDEDGSLPPDTILVVIEGQSVAKMFSPPLMDPIQARLMVRLARVDAWRSFENFGSHALPNSVQSEGWKP